MTSSKHMVWLLRGQLRSNQTPPANCSLGGAHGGGGTLNCPCLAILAQGMACGEPAAWREGTAPPGSQRAPKHKGPLGSQGLLGSQPVCQSF